MPLDQNKKKSVSLWMRRLFNVCVRAFCAPNATILFVYIPAKIKMSFIWKDDFFFVKIGIFCKSIAGPLREAYTQPYSFGGRIKLIICQIRHELSVTILSLFIFEEKMLNYASGPKYSPNSGLFWVHRLFNVCVRVFCACLQNDLHLKRWYFAKIGITTIFVRRKDKANYLSNQTWAKCYHSRNKH